MIFKKVILKKSIELKMIKIILFLVFLKIKKHLLGIGEIRRNCRGAKVS